MQVSLLRSQFRIGAYFVLILLASFSRALAFEYQWLDAMPQQNEFCAVTSKLLSSPDWLASKSFHFGFSDKIMAIRVAGSETNELLHFSFPVLNQVTLVTNVGQGEFCEVQENGSWTDRPLRRVDAVGIFLEIPKSNSVAFVKTSSPFNVKHEFVNKLQADHISKRFMVFNSLYVGFVFALILYNLFLWFSTRDNLYALYSGYMSCMLVFFTAMNHLILYYTQIIPKSYYASVTCIAAAMNMICLTIFSRKLLGINQSGAEWVKKLLDLSVAISFCLIVLNIVYPSTWVIVSTNIGGTFAVLSLLIGSLMARPQRTKNVFLAAFLPYLSAAVVWVLQNTGLIEANFATENAVQFFQALEGLIFSFALGDKLKQEQQARFEVELRFEQEKERSVRSVKLARLEQTGFLAMKLADQLHTPLLVVRMNISRIERLLPELSDDHKDKAQDILRTLRSSSEKMQQNIVQLGEFKKYAPEDSLVREIRDSAS